MTQPLNTSDPRYWEDQKIAVALINDFRLKEKIARNAPQYIAGAFDCDYGDYEPVENLGPWDDEEDAAKAILNSPPARAMAQALGLCGMQWI